VKKTLKKKSKPSKCKTSGSATKLKEFQERKTTKTKQEHLVTSKKSTKTRKGKL